MHYDNCPNCFMPLGGAHVCPHCNCDIDGLKIYQDALPVFTVLNQRYMVGCVLLNGGFGVTYVILDLQTNKLCAIQEYMSAEASSRAQDALTIEATQYIYKHGKEMFVKEARNLKALGSYCSLVGFCDFFAENNTGYLVRECIKQDLRAMAKKNGGKLELEFAKTILITVAKGLAQFHESGLLHREICLENIVVTTDERIVLTSFNAVCNFVKKQRRGMSVLLRPRFTPPEQYSF